MKKTENNVEKRKNSLKMLETFLTIEKIKKEGK